ncbi:MAG: 3-oxoacyl-[acyl-carrier-protein] synthase III C-terminal domain-containing protein [Pseudomonadota bacterium]
MSGFGILSAGAFAPRQRIARAAIADAMSWAQPALKSAAKGVRAFAAWDEDPITLGVEAARSAVKSAPGVRADQLCFASTTAPFLDRQNAGVIAAALDLPAETFVFETSGGQRAATSALIAAGASRERATLAVAADVRPVRAGSPLEMQAGDAGAAVLLGPGDPIAEFLGANSVYADLVDHYRTAETGVDYVLEERWYRDVGLSRLAPSAAAPLLEEAGVSAAEITHLIAPSANPSLAGATAKALGVDRGRLADSLYDYCGHAGVAHPLLALVETLKTARPGETVLVLGFGQGCDALLFRTTEALRDFQERAPAPIADDPYRTEENYLRFLSARGAIDVDWGMRAERDNRTAHTVAFDKSRAITGFVGGRCRVCGTPQFPKSRRCVNPDCAALDTQDDYRFADRRATIKSYTEDWLAFTREPPLVYGNVSFEGGGNVFMEMCDFAPGDAAVGAALAMRLRIKDVDTQRGFHRYFWNAAPAEGGAHG